MQTLQMFAKMATVDCRGGQTIFSMVRVDREKFWNF